jgi:hypothetical protein
MKLHRNESGQMLIMAAIELTLLIGFLALATDVGVLFHSKRHMQIAADAAATAGAVNELDGGPSVTGLSDQKVADKAAADNGYTDGQNGVAVNVYSGSLGQIKDGYHTGPGYVEVVITKPDPLYFFKFLTGNSTTNVAARAVAGSPGAAKDCAFLMDPTGVDMQLQGSATIDTPGCAWYVNSDGAATGSTTNQTGTGATLTAPYVSSVGPAGTTSLGGTPVYSGVVTQGTPPIQSVGAVPPGDCTITESGPTYPSTIDGSDGVVCFTGSNVDISGLTLENGVFVFESGVIAGNPTGNTNMTNATLEVYGGSFTQNSNSNLNITAPASLTETFGGLSYNGVALLVPAANTTYTNTDCQTVQHGTLKNRGALTVQIGSSGQTLDGYIVAPNSSVFLNDNGGGTTITGLVAACLFNKSSSLTINSYNAAHPTTSPLRVVSLVE